MAINFGSVGAKAVGTTTDITPALPASLAENDILIAHVAVGAAVTLSTPAGWNLLTTQATGGSPNFTLHIFWKYAGASEASPSFARGSAPLIIGAISRWTGVPVRANPWLLTPVKQAGSGTTMNGLDMTPGVTGAMAIWFWSQSDNGITSSVTNSAAIAYNGTNYNETTGGGSNVSAAYKLAAGTGPVGATNMTSASGTQNAFVGCALDPSASTVPKSGSDSAVGSESGSVAAATSGSDTATGSETGFVAQLKSGTDTATGSDTGFVAQLNAGSDTAAGSETGSLSATTSGSDTAVGASSGSLLASTFGSDTAVGSSSGFITLPGSDAATGATALVSLHATTSGSDSGVGSEGGYVEELFGDLNVALWAIHPTTGAPVPLPDFVKLELSRERNGPGSITLDYPVDGRNFDILRDTVTEDRDLEIEIWTVGSKAGALRGFLQEANGDDVAEEPVWTFAGGLAELLLNEAVAFPAPIITTTTVTTTTKTSVDPAPASYQVKKVTTVASSAGGPPVTSTVTTTETSGTEGTTTDSKSTKGDLEFAAVTPGELMNFLLDGAEDRGSFDGLLRGFSDTHDSAGVAWPQVITSKFSPGSEYDSVLGRLVDFGLAEWGVVWTGSAYRLDMWVIFGRGVDRTLGLRPVILRKGRNLLDAPRKWSVRESGTAVLAAGAEGVYESASDVDALARRGRRIERFASANNLEDHAAVQAFAQNELTLTKTGQLEITHGIGFTPGEPRPVIAYDIGDWIYSQGSADMERLRVVQWTLSFEANSASGTTTLNDTFTDYLSRLKALIDNLTSGDTVVGTSTSSGGQDNSTPLPPEVLSAESIAFLDGTLGVRAAVTIALDMPVLNVDGTVITDMESVVVQFALASSPDVWNAGITKRAPTEQATFTAPAGQTITIRAAVVDRNGNTSVWSDPPLPHTTSDDDIPPPIPSTPTVSEFLGTIRINWDQLTAAGANMLDIVDFDHVEVHMSTGSLFTPSEATLVGQVHAKQTYTITDLPYGVTQFARLVAVDWSGNRSDPSGQGSATPAQVVHIDIGPNAIDRTQIIDAEIVTAKIANLAVNNAKIADLAVGKLTSGTVTADMLLSGSIKTATSGNRTEMDSAGLRLYNGVNVVVDLKTSNGSALVVGEFRTALTGQRVVFNPGGSLPDTLNFYPSAAGDFARIMARTAPGDGSAAILIDGGAANGTARGRIGAYKSEAFISYVTNDSGGDTSAGFSRTAVSCRTNDIGMWVQTSVRMQKYSGTTLLAGSNFEVKWVAGSTSSNTPMISAFDADAGLKLDDTFICATNAAGNAFYAFKGNAFIVSSGQDTKTDIEPLGAVLNPLRAVRAAKGRRFRYRAEVAAQGKQARHRFGVLAEEMPAAIVQLSPSSDGSGMEKSLNIADWQGLTHAALGQHADETDTRFDVLEARLVALESRNG